MTFRHLLAVNLHLFDGGAAGAGGGNGAAAPAGSGTMGEASASPVNTQQGKKTGDLSSVKYGKERAANTGVQNPAQAPAAEGAITGVTTTSDTLEARQKEFDDLINSDKYKDIYTKRTQDMIDRRFSKAKAAESENAKLREIADMIGQKYGISEDSDFSKLKAAIENDDEIWAEAADEAGMSIEQYKKFSALQKKNAAFEAARQNDMVQMQNRQKAETWYREAQELKAKFPQFDLKTELSDRNFMLQSMPAFLWSWSIRESIMISSLRRPPRPPPRPQRRNWLTISVQRANAPLKTVQPPKVQRSQ
jgi:acyl transferase domain-containing protein